MARRVCQVGSIGLQVNWVVGRVGSGRVGFTCIFQTSFFFFQLQKKKSITTYLERMNKIN